MVQDDLPVRIEHLRERIDMAARRAGRDPGEISLLAASKTVPAERIRLGISSGLRHIGENRVQEAEAKFTQCAGIRAAATWHFIGHLQSNKARRAVQLFDVIQTVDNARLVHHLNRAAADMSRTVPVYLEVNIGLESTKSGISPEMILPLAETVAEASHLRLEGLMSIPPYTEDLGSARAHFRELRELRDALKRHSLFGEGAGDLSMGMSHDYEVAIEEGATIVRIGTAIWGPRPE